MYLVSPQLLAAVSALFLSIPATPMAGQGASVRPGPAVIVEGSGYGAPATPDSAAAVAAVRRFHDALAAGDSATVITMLAPDVVILESGDVETLADYRRHHLGADIEFARAVPSTHSVVRVVVQGDAAWVSSTSITQGRMKERPVNSAGAELVVLSRRDGHSPWRIRAIHWSSHRRST